MSNLVYQPPNDGDDLVTPRLPLAKVQGNLPQWFRCKTPFMELQPLPLHSWSRVDDLYTEGSGWLWSVTVSITLSCSLSDGYGDVPRIHQI
mmetsp:Transcript_8954/g.22208  ORF Transcript_8954/g.22208 Transcript_8954/m.22208 type:complete len:91 (-) Transcript_8954:1188-1460(-)